MHPERSSRLSNLQHTHHFSPRSAFSVDPLLRHLRLRILKQHIHSHWHHACCPGIELTWLLLSASSRKLVCGSPTRFPPIPSTCTRSDDASSEPARRWVAPSLLSPCLWEWTATIELLPQLRSYKLASADLESRFLGLEQEHTLNMIPRIWRLMGSIPSKRPLAECLLERRRTISIIMWETRISTRYCGDI
jgi:hypothetical protein